MGSGYQHASWALLLAFMWVMAMMTLDLWAFTKLAISWGAFFLGADLPDIDVCSSKIHRGLLFPKLYGTRFKHWGHCHSIVMGICYGLLWLPLSFYLGMWTPLYAFLGVVLHLIVDEGYKSKNNKRKAFKWW